MRKTATAQILGRLGEFALPGPIAELKGVVEFVVGVPKGEPERHTLRFDGTGVEVSGRPPRPRRA